MRRPTLPLLLFVPALFCAGCAPLPVGAQLTDAAADATTDARAEAGSLRYRILVSNDDGIDSPRLHSLVLELAKIGEVFVVAPSGNRSGSSHSMSNWRLPTVVTEKKVQGAVVAQAVSGTPADAVNFGLFTFGLEKPFDVVVSGINKGHNVGFVAHVSGTVGAAMEAVARGVPGVAVSADDDQADDGISARFTAAFVKKLLVAGSPPGVGYNINVPAGDAKEYVFAPMGGAFFRTTGYQPKAGATVPTFEEVSEEGTHGPPGCDTRHYCEGKITVAPIRVDWTDAAMLRRMQQWKLEVR